MVIEGNIFNHRFYDKTKLQPQRATFCENSVIMAVMKNAEKSATTTEKNIGVFRILVYGIDRLGYNAPAENLITQNISLTFAPFDTELKFQDFNAVILFQGIWATWHTSHALYSDGEYLTDIQNGMLRVRVKQLQALFTQGGFICFLMGRMVHDDFDLAKEVLSWFSNTYYNRIGDNEFFRKIYFGELLNYFNSDYGVSKTKFTHLGDADYRVIADISNYDGDVAVCFDRRIFFLPCHAIKKDESNVINLFKTLAPGLVATFKKLNQELPKWADDFKFTPEAKLSEQRKKLEEDLSGVKKEIITMEDFKKPLVLSGPMLAESIQNLMKNGMSLEVTNKDKGYEDLQLWDRPEEEKGPVVAVIESKGVNGNVDRAAINQVDDHRERNGYDGDFPGVLIANTFIKSSNSLVDKDKPIEQEQINHAVKMRVLILRTLDLIRAYDMILSGTMKIEDFKKILLAEKGWLEISDGKVIPHH